MQNNNLLFMLQLVFPPDYPTSPPKLNLFTAIPHPNVFSNWDGEKGNWVCLNMLRPPVQGSTYSGWSSAYSAQSILLQLQTFLTAENIPQDYGGAVKSTTEVSAVDHAKEQIDKFVCAACGHSYRNPFPPLPPAELVTISNR